MATQGPQQASVERAPPITSATVSLQCVASVAGTLVGHSLGSTLPAQLVAGVLGALIGAFLTAPGRYRRRRLVAVALLLALLDALRRTGKALASEREPVPHAWLPANWAVVGLTAVVGIAGGSAVTTVAGGWADDRPRVLAVPEVRGEPREEALAILDGAGLRASTTMERSQSIPDGSATRTVPPAGASIDDGVELTLYVSSGPPGARVEIPDVTGLPRSAAVAVLEDAGLQPRATTEPSDVIVGGNATRTDPPAGSSADPGAVVALLVSTGPGPGSVRIPEVFGRSRSDALALLRDAGLRADSASEPSRDVAEGLATRTDPPVDTAVAPGARVMLFVSSGPPAPRVEVPPVAGLPERQARSVLEDAGLSPAVQREPSLSVARGVVTRTQPPAGSLADEGATIAVFVSSGPPPETPEPEDPGGTGG